MLTNGPAATIGEDLAVNLPRPRTALESAVLPEYHRARQSVLRFLHQRYSNPLDAAA
jgi:nitrate/nitrite transport system ATP-binding protein